MSRIPLIAALALLGCGEKTELEKVEPDTGILQTATSRIARELDVNPEVKRCITDSHNLFVSFGERPWERTRTCDSSREILACAKQVEAEVRRLIPQVIVPITAEDENDPHLILELAMLATKGAFLAADAGLTEPLNRDCGKDASRINTLRFLYDIQIDLLERWSRMRLLNL